MNKKKEMNDLNSYYCFRQCSHSCNHNFSSSIVSCQYSVLVLCCFHLLLLLLLSINYVVLINHLGLIVDVDLFYFFSTTNSSLSMLLYDLLCLPLPSSHVFACSCCCFSAPSPPLIAKRRRRFFWLKFISFYDWTR